VMIGAMGGRSRHAWLVILALVLALGCAGPQIAPQTAAPPPAPTAQPATAPGGPASDLLNAVLWMQRSVEYKANALTAFALARIRLDQALEDRNWTAAPKEQTGAYQSLPPAIVLDIDESILDNSGYQAWMTLKGTSFDPKTWNAYVNTVTSQPIPGAVEFANYAASKGVKVFYVSNRTAEEEPATRKNLEKLGFPMGGDVDTMLMTRKKPDAARPERPVRARSPVRVDLRHGRFGGRLERGDDLAGPDALHGRGLRAVRARLAPGRASRRRVGPARDDGGLLSRHGRVGSGHRGRARRLVAGRRADRNGRLLVDLSPGRHPHARAEREEPGLHDRPQRAGRQPRHRRRRRAHGLPREVCGLACRLRRARPHRARVRRAVRAGRAPRRRPARQAPAEDGRPAALGAGACAHRDDLGRRLGQPDLQLHDERQRPAPDRAPARGRRRSRVDRRAARRRLHRGLVRAAHRRQADRSGAAQMGVRAGRGRADPAVPLRL